MSKSKKGKKKPLKLIEKILIIIDAIANITVIIEFLIKIFKD